MNSKRFYFLFPILFILADAIAVTISFIGSYSIEFNSIIPTGSYLYALLISLVIWVTLDIAIKDYKIGRNTTFTRTFNKSARSVAIFISILLFIWVFSDYKILDRSFLGTYFMALLLVVAVSRLSTHWSLNHYRSLGRNFRNAVIVGYDKLGFSLFDALQRNRYHGIICKGFYGDEGENVTNYEKLGGIFDFLKSKWDELDFVYVSGHLKRDLIDKIIERADNEFVKVKLLPTFATYQPKIYTLKRFDNISIIDVNDLPLDNIFNRIIKRTFDIAFSLIVMVFVMSWLYPLIALIIQLETPGPVIFKQLRHGKNNKKFWCFKFRTMVINEESDTRWATKNDPRVTRFGKFLRISSLDELPQFINVLRGEMAIVGPRPHAVEMNEHYRTRVDKFYQRHAFKPGITGLAQAMGYRGEIREFYHIKNRVKLDRFYFQNWSFWFDLKIIVKTIYVLFRGQEAAY